MKKFLMMIVVVLFFSGCSSVSTQDMDEKAAKWLSTSPDWSDYFEQGYQPTVHYTSPEGGLSDIIDLGGNVVGITRDVANELVATQYVSSQFNFDNYAGDNDSPKMFYFTMTDGIDIEAGSLQNYIKYSDPRNNSGVTYTADIDIKGLLSVPGNTGVVVGDEIAKINIYSDSALTKLHETFSFVL